MGQLFATIYLLIGTVVPPVAGISAVALAYRRRWWFAVSCWVLFLASSQVSMIPYLVGLDNPFPVLHYETVDGGFRGSECFKSTACTWDQLALDLADYRRSRGDASIELVRTFRPNPWRFWRWLEYATDLRWRLRYQPPRYCLNDINDQCTEGPAPHYRQPAQTLQEVQAQRQELAPWAPDLLAP